jgi:hypothetical protein
MWLVICPPPREVKRLGCNNTDWLPKTRRAFPYTLVCMTGSARQNPGASRQVAMVAVSGRAPAAHVHRPSMADLADKGLAELVGKEAFKSTGTRKTRRIKTSVRSQLIESIRMLKSLTPRTGEGNTQTPIVLLLRASWPFTTPVQPRTWQDASDIHAQDRLRFVIKSFGPLLHTWTRVRFGPDSVSWRRVCRTETVIYLTPDAPLVGMESIAAYRSLSLRAAWILVSQTTVDHQGILRSIRQRLSQHVLYYLPLCPEKFSKIK